MRIAARVHRALTVTQSTKSGGISHGCLQQTCESARSRHGLSPHPPARVRNSAEKEAVVAARKLAPSLSVSQNSLYLSQETTLAIISYQGFLRGIIEVCYFITRVWRSRAPTEGIWPSQDRHLPVRIRLWDHAQRAQWRGLSLSPEGHGMTPHSLCWARINSPVNIRRFNSTSKLE